MIVLTNGNVSTLALVEPLSFRGGAFVYMDENVSRINEFKKIK